MTERVLRQARPEDGADIVAFTGDTWSEQGIGDDAAELGVDRARLCVPATPRYASDAAVVASLYDETIYVFGADLTGGPPG